MKIQPHHIKLYFMAIPCLLNKSCYLGSETNCRFVYGCTINYLINWYLITSWELSERERDEEKKR